MRNLAMNSRVAATETRSESIIKWEKSAELQFPHHGPEPVWTRVHVRPRPDCALAVSCFHQLPRHVRSLDVGGILTDGQVVSLGNVDELSLLSQYVEGQGYNLDVERLGTNL
jgi:hypothetical protein